MVWKRGEGDSVSYPSCAKESHKLSYGYVNDELGQDYVYYFVMAGLSL